MEKTTKLKIFIAIFYSVIVSIFLIYLFSKFSIEEITSYKFIQLNRDYLFDFKESNLTFSSLIFLFFTIIWVLLLGFGSPIALLGGFIFGKWIGTLIVTIGLTTGATFFYIFCNYFFKDFVRKKFLQKFKKLDSKFKKNEFIFFIIFRFIGSIPFQVANVIPIIFNVSIKNYFFGTFLGILPQIFIYVSLGSGIEKIVRNNELLPSVKELIFSPDIYTPILGFIFLLLITFIIKKFFYKN